MRVIPSDYKKSTDLPLKLKISFEPVFQHLEKIGEDDGNYLQPSASKLLDEYQDLTILRDGFEDFNNLNKYHKEINKVLDVLFPDLLQSNEIKAASIPFEFTTFKLSKRFQQILDNAGENYKFKLRNFDESNIYILACTFILAYCYNVKIDFRRPFYFDIPDINTGLTKHYRTLFNGDFFTVKPLKNTIPITDEDVKVLLDNFNNIDIWKEKFPPNSYEFKGFGIMNLFDVTADQAITNLKENLIRKDQDGFEGLEQSISNLFGSTTLKLGFATYHSNDNGVQFKNYKDEKSFIQLADCTSKECKGFFCDGIIDKVFKKHELVAISDIEEYGKNTNYNGFYNVLKSQNIKSIILVPLKLNEDSLGVLELVSTNTYELNSINAYKLKDVIPVFKVAVKRYMEEFENKLESVIQENYTSLHPTVKWKFYDRAEEYLFQSQVSNKSNINLKDIIFENVIPLYGQSDIKGSSVARNSAIQADLVKQLNLASDVIRKAYKLYNLPIYNDLLYRIDECLHNIKNGLNSGDEVGLTDFLKKDIYPVFNHLKALDSELKEDIAQYMSYIDSELHVVYDKRKKYEESVNTLNEELAKFIDTKQIEAQNMFPHYFERYKTDGIDYNMYIGQSLVKNNTYNEMYLNNLRLWQLQLMCEVENIAFNLKNKLEHPLEITSLILVHNTPLSIKFRMDEKRFDVDGAYNIRYEIIKKRIDKIHIKNTTERLTQPGKISIVYSQNKDASEYMKYIKYLQSNKCLNETVENLDLEDLQGISGLKALRVGVNYENLPDKNITLDVIMDVVNNDTLN